MNKKSCNKKRALNGTNWVPSVKQLAVIEMLVNPEDTRTKEQKREAAGVPKRTFYNWLKKPELVCYMNNLLHGLLKLDEIEAYRSLRQQIRRGNVQAIRTYYELIGKLGKVRLEHTGEGGGPIKTMGQQTFIFQMAEPPDKNGAALDEDDQEGI